MAAPRDCFDTVGCPPGLQHCDSSRESATTSRARRRLQAAVQSAISELHQIYDKRLVSSERKIDRLLECQSVGDGDVIGRMDRIETLFTCVSPSVDVVLSELLRKQRRSNVPNHECDVPLTPTRQTEPAAEPSPYKSREISCAKSAVIRCRRVS